MRVTLFGLPVDILSYEETVERILAAIATGERCQHVALNVAKLALAVFFAVMVWNASGSGGLVIEPFSVPPDLASRGLTSEVVAAKLLDQERK